MKKRSLSKGLEPDACFYVQTASVIGNQLNLDFETDLPPDIAVEIDVHHDSRHKFAIYEALGVPEIWRYDGREMTIYQLDKNRSESNGPAYVPVETSIALPMLTARLLTEMLERMRDEGELIALLAFDERLLSRGDSN